MNPFSVTSVRTAGAVLALFTSLPLVAMADATNGPLVALGFTNTPIGGTTLEVIDGGVLFVGDTANGGGVSVELGEAEAGVFLFPLTGYLYGGEMMEGKAYGKINGVTNQFISSVLGMFNGSGQSSVLVDFSALGASNLSVFVDGFLIGHVTNSSVSILVNGSGYDSRANPWGRSPDGHGALVTLASGGWFSLPTESPEPPILTGPPGSGSGYGNTLFVRPDDPTNSVENIARVEVTSTGLGSFCLTDARLDAFHLPHKSLGVATMLPSGGQLVIGNLISNIHDGILVELPSVGSFNLDFLPIEFPTTNSGIIMSAFGTSAGLRGTAAGSLSILQCPGFVQISTEMGIAPQNIEVQVRSNGVVVGSATVNAASGIVNLSGTPDIVGCTVLAKTLDTLPGFAVRVESPTTFTVAGGGAFVGDELRLLAPEPVFFESLENFVMGAKELPSFTITGETTTTVPQPSLSFTRSANGLTLSWPNPNRNYILELAMNLDDGFSTQLPDFSHTNNFSRLTVNTEGVGQQFFRLRRIVD